MNRLFIFAAASNFNPPSGSPYAHPVSGWLEGVAVLFALALVGIFVLILIGSFVGWAFGSRKGFKEFLMVVLSLIFGIVGVSVAMQLTHWGFLKSLVVFYAGITLFGVAAALLVNLFRKPK